MTAEPIRCQRCVLDTRFPGVTIRDGICSYCAGMAIPTELAARREALRDKMLRIVEDERGRGEYDCVVAFSGGKDSSYTLKMLARDHGLSCLAVTINNGFLSERAIENCKAVTAALGVDFMMFTPSFQFMRGMYVRSMEDEGIHARAAIKRASSVCNSCINLINTHMIKLAVRHDIPVIAGGYVGGQVPHDSAVLRLDLDRMRQQQEAGLARKVAAFGADAARHFAFVPPRGGRSEVVVINPMTTVAVTEDEIVAAIGELGWQRTADTGLHSSNCRLNDLGIAVHHRRHGFHPYALEISEQVRTGLMTRNEGLRRIASVPAMRDLTAQLAQLDLRAELP